MASIFLGNTNGTGDSNGFSRISQFDAATGALVAQTFIKLVNKVLGVMLSSGTLYVATENGSPAADGIVIGSYNGTTGAVVNATLIPNIPGTFRSFHLVSGVIYVEVTIAGKVVVYSFTATTGAIAGNPLVVNNSVLGDAGGMAVG